MIKMLPSNPKDENPNMLRMAEPQHRIPPADGGNSGFSVRTHPKSAIRQVHINVDLLSSIALLIVDHMLGSRGLLALCKEMQRTV